MRLTCATCGSDLEIGPEVSEGRSSVPCPVCSSPVSLVEVTLELDDGDDDLDIGALPQALPDLDTRDMTPSPVHDPSSLDFVEEEDVEAEDDSPRARAIAKLARLASPAPRAAPIPRPMVHTAVSVSRRSGSPWRGTIGWCVFVAVVMVVASTIAYRRSLPPPPPRIANPLEKAADRWLAEGTVAEPMPVKDAIAIATTKLQGSRSQRLEALRVIQRGLVDEPNAPEAIAVYARALSTLPSARDERTVALALRGITAAIGDAPDSRYRSQLEEARGWLLLEEGRLDQARDAASRAIEFAPASTGAQAVRAASNAEFRPSYAAPALRGLLDDPVIGHEARRWLAVSLLRSGEVNDAITMLETGAELAPNADALLRELYELRYAMGQTEEARVILERLLELGLASLADRIQFARDIARNDRDADRALAILDDGLRDELAGKLRVAEVYAEKVIIASTTPGFIPDPRELGVWLERGFELAPELPVLLYANTLADDVLERTERALDGLELANGMYPEIPEMAVKLAWRLRTLDPPAAIEVIDDALEATLDSIPLYLMAAVLAFDQNRPVRAFQRIKRALAIDPEVNLRRAARRAYPAPVDTYRQIGDELAEQGRVGRNAITTSAGAAAYYVAGDFRRTSRALTQALKLDRRDASANLYSGILMLRKKRQGLARNHFTVAWEEDRGLPLVQIYHARLQESIGERAKAERLYREILHQNASATSAQTGLARVLWESGNRAEALAEARKVLAVRPNDREALSFLATRNKELKSPRRRRRPEPTELR